MLRRARQLLGDAAEAEEALHDLFASLVDRPEQFAGRSAMTTFLYSATTHLCLNRLRDRRRRQEILHGEAVAAAAKAAAAPGDAARAPGAERLAMLRELLRRMPDELAAPAVFYYVDEMTHDEIAEVLGCSRRHVGDLVERARAWVAAELRDAGARTVGRTDAGTSVGPGEGERT